MKKKILSILCALIICLSPVLFLAGCTTTDKGVTMAGTTGWKVAQNGSFASITVPDTFSITYTIKEYNKTSGEYEDKTIELKKDGTYNGETIASAQEAFEIAIQNGLRALEGFDTSTEGSKTMKVIFGGETFTVEYTVGEGGTETVTKHNFNDTNGDGKCDTAGCEKEEDETVHN